MLKNLIAIPDLNSQAAGAVCYWRLSGPLSREKLAEAWDARNLHPDELPRPVSVPVAIRRAAMSMKQPGRLVISLKGDKGYTIAVDGHSDGTTLQHRIECRVTGESWIRVEPSDHPWRREIEAEFEKQLRELQAMDISMWLVTQAERHDAVSLRDTGGFYFIPPHRLPAWRTLCEAVGAASSHQLYEIPAMASEKAMLAVVDALSEEARAFAAKMEEELREGEIGQRAMESRQDRCHEMVDKIGRYEGLLGQSLDTLRARIGAIQAELTAGILSAMAEDDEAAAS